jgi:hypothetical protein
MSPMRCSRTLSLLAIALLSTTSPDASRAQDCPGVAIGADSKTTATAGPPTTDGPNAGHPATSTASNGLANPGFNVSVSGLLGVDGGYFDSSTHAGGDIDIHCCASDSAIVRTNGHVADCLLLAGYQGSGFLHVPVHITGSALAEWSISSEYQASPGAVFAGNQISVGCSVHVGQQPFACTGDYREYDADQSFDDTIELVAPFTFGASTEFEWLSSANSSIGYVANGSEGTMSTTANLSVLGVLEPAYVVDGVGTPLPNATITASSGFDYLHPAPEPSAPAAASLLTLALLSTARAGRR